MPSRRRPLPGALVRALVLACALGAGLPWSAHAVAVRSEDAGSPVVAGDPLPRLVGGGAIARPGSAAPLLRAEDELAPVDPVDLRRAAAERALAAWAGPGAPLLTARWNPWTGLPHRAFGARLRAAPAGARLERRDDAVAAARTFLFARPALWAGEDRPGASDLEIAKAHRVGTTWFLAFRQRHRGLEVAGGRVDLRLREDGSVALLGSDWFPGIAVSPLPRLPRGVADARVRGELGFLAARGDRVEETAAPTVIVPLPGADGTIAYRLAHRLRHRIVDPPGLWENHVDAETGATLGRENLLRFDTLTGTTTGLVHPATPTDVPVSRAFVRQVVTSGVDSVFSTATGTYALPNIPTGIPIRTALRGPRLEVIRWSAANAAQSASSPAQDVLHWAWTNANSDTAERDAYWHAQVAHDWVKRVDPGFTGLDYRMPCTVNLPSQCNAYWDGLGINFYRWGIRPSDGQACANTAHIGDVVHHEYGHGRTQFVFAPFAPTGAMHEGFSDYMAASVTGQPLIGRGFFGPGTHLRTAANTQRIDFAGCLGEGHCVGIALSGALWDLRGRLVASLGATAGVRLADSLFHYAGYGGAEWHEDYLLDLLVVDDDDGNLLSGTPNFADVCAAFTPRGIPCPDVMPGAWIVHEPLPDATPGSGPWAVDAQVGSFAGQFDAASPVVSYRVNGGPLQDRAMTALGGGSYRAFLPNLAAGGNVEYAIRARDFGTGTATLPSNAPQELFAFHVGALQTVWTDDFQVDRGWTGAVAGAPTGRWMRVDPNGTTTGGTPVTFFAPEDDHTPGAGTFCFVTHDTTAGQSAGVADVDEGCVTLTSPVISLAGLANARLEYWRWFVDETRMDDTLVVAVSSDGGGSWVELERVYRTAGTWTARAFDVGAAIPLTAQFRLRLRVCDGGGGSLVEAGLDDVVLTTRAFSTVGAAEPAGAAVAGLERATPNPARAGEVTRLSFGVPRGGAPARLEVIDVRGRVVRRLVDGALPAGRHVRPWNGEDDGGARVGAGVYFVRLSIDGHVQRVKVVRLD